VITWLASPTRLQLGPAPQEGLAADAWALLNALLQEVFARHQGAVEAQARMVAAVSKAEQLLTIASEEVTAAAEEEERAAEGGEEGGEGGGGGGRQRIPVPGTRGPVSRLQMAKMREEAGSRKVTAAQLDVGRQAEVVQRLAVERAEATMTVRAERCGVFAGLLHVMNDAQCAGVDGRGLCMEMAPLYQLLFILSKRGCYELRCRKAENGSSKTGLCTGSQHPV